MGNTLIQVSDELWEYLNSHKDRGCKTFEDVIWRFIKYDGELEPSKEGDASNSQNKIEGIKNDILPYPKG